MAEMWKFCSSVRSSRRRSPVRRRTFVRRPAQFRQCAHLRTPRYTGLRTRGGVLGCDPSVDKVLTVFGANPSKSFNVQLFQTYRAETVLSPDKESQTKTAAK